MSLLANPLVRGCAGRTTIGRNHRLPDLPGIQRGTDRCGEPNGRSGLVGTDISVALADALSAFRASTAFLGAINSIIPDVISTLLALLVWPRRLALLQG